jgi:glycosyl transferase, family 25
MNYSGLSRHIDKFQLFYYRFTTDKGAGRMATQVPIFVINMDDSPRRLETMAARLGELGLSFERLPAINGRLLSEEEKRRINPKRSWCYLQDSELGCYLSHLKAFREIAGRGIPRAIVMEDDALFEPDFSVWAQSDCPLPAGCDILKLEGFGAQNCPKIPISAYASRTIYYSYKHTGGAAAYIITLEGARKALKNLRIVRGQFDYDLFLWRNGLSVYDVYPYPARQDGTSTMHRPPYARTLRMRAGRWFLKNYDRAGRIYVNSRRFGAVTLIKAWLRPTLVTS